MTSSRARRGFRPARAAFLGLLLAAVPSARGADRFDRAAAAAAEAAGRGDAEALRRAFSPGLSAALPLEAARELVEGVRRRSGAFVRLGLSDRRTPGRATYTAFFEKGALDLTVVLDSRGRLDGLWFLPFRPRVPAPGRNLVKLGLPVRGRWRVLWGGPTEETNHHHASPPERYAFDFVKRGPRGESHSGEGFADEDYPAFGEPVAAPADGVVLEAVDGVPDNAPGHVNMFHALGNAVVIKHGDLELSVLAHLKQGSVAVRRGDVVKRGQAVGQCGNSGNSTEPHLHYHLQSGEELPEGEGIPVSFDRLFVERAGVLEERRDYSPVQGDVLSTEASP